MLVNFYAPLFFLEVSSVQPQGFCKKIGLCRNALVFFHETFPCDICHKAVDEAIDKLKDPDTEVCISLVFTFVTQTLFFPS